MEATWRWFGPQDPISLRDARQAGATGIVSALHDFAPGTVWPVEAIEERQRRIEAAGLSWSVVESVNVSEAIKRRNGPWRAHVDAYVETLRNLAQCGMRVVCYNAMPVLDWLRTDLSWELDDGSVTMRLDEAAMAAFDLFVLRREGAEAEWSAETRHVAEARFQAMTEGERGELERIVLAGLPGSKDVYSLAYLRESIAVYRELGRDGFRANVCEFLRAVAPVAEELGVRLCIHPDDPPRTLLGLPRICSTTEDLRALMAATPEPANGVTFCSGSLGVRADNDLPAMLLEFAARVWFVHLRATRREANPASFHEAPHLEGDVDMVALICLLVREERRRREAGDERAIPFRADHGLKILTDRERECVPGYPAVGRLKGLAELRGALAAVERLL
jgi:mannonate dehydratase